MSHKRPLVQLYLSYLSEYDKSFFQYGVMEKDMWTDLVHNAKKQFKVFFNLENNDTRKKQRIITIPQTQWEHTKCQFKCEMYAAGGDWERPVLYFRCQLIKGYAFELGTYSKSHFVYIPGKEGGNNHLWYDDSRGWFAPDDNGYKDGIDPVPDERKCWQSLEEFLKDLVELEIEKIQLER
ncbi:hypothetical protein KAR91_16085 [Candidatus Pacearchaeota archaeon]|nr:hypothetical protein [Candidatus Pacearchaeota archaeon]